MCRIPAMPDAPSPAALTLPTPENGATGRRNAEPQRESKQDGEDSKFVQDALTRLTADAGDAEGKTEGSADSSERRRTRPRRSSRRRVSGRYILRM